MISSPIIAIAWKGPNAITLVRKNITDERRSNMMGTIRGNYSMNCAHFVKIEGQKLNAKNVCHASEN
jgi:nucleoside diphosphate kinase